MVQLSTRVQPTDPTYLMQREILCPKQTWRYDTLSGGCSVSLHASLACGLRLWSYSVLVS